MHGHFQFLIDFLDIATDQHFIASMNNYIILRNHIILYNSLLILQLINIFIASMNNYIILHNHIILYIKSPIYDKVHL